MSQSDFVTRGQALVTAGQYQEAVKVCRLGLLGRPTTVEGRVVLGQALLALKRFDEVLAEMRVALELDPSSITAQVLKAEALFRKGDTQAAVELLRRVRTQLPDEPRIASLLEEAERALGRPRVTAAHPAVGFVSPAASSQPLGSPASAPADFMTRAYLPPAPDEEDTDSSGDEDTGGSFTRPTSIAAPSAKRSKQLPSQPAARAAAAVLAVGDRSGTVEVDPELDGVEVEDDDLASPPRSRGSQPKPLAGARGAVVAGSRAPRPAAVAPKKSVPKPLRKQEISTVELDDDEIVEIEPTPVPTTRQPGARSAVRNAVKIPSGPIDALEEVAANRPTAHQPIPTAPPHLAHLVGTQPANARSQIVSALPTAAAMQVPSPYAGNPYGQPLPPTHAAAQPTMALHPQAHDAMYGGQPGWAPAPAGGGDAPAANLFVGDSVPPVAYGDSVSQSHAKAMKTGVRRGRSRLQLVVWVMLGALVIGGGVFAGFQIRAMRLGKQIDAARQQAMALARSDTWQGWLGARDRLAGIVQASATLDNRAALARTRALVAFEFGDGLVEAKAAVDALNGQGGLDGKLAVAYLALAQGNPKAARAAVDAVGDTEDAAVLYVAGHAHLLGGEIKLAVASLETAIEKDVRPAYAVGLARALGHATQWDEAIAAADRALALVPEHPGALIERARLLAASGRIVPSGSLGSEVRVQLEKVVAEGAKPLAQQQPTRGVSPAQVAFADLALARVDFARGDVNAAQTNIRNALAIGIDEQRFAEEVVETLHVTGAFANARTAADRVLSLWPASRRARTTLAEVALAQGIATEAIELLGKGADQDPRGLAVRGQARLVGGDLDGARVDFDAALKKAPTLELAIIGHAWLELQAGDLDAARARVEPRFNAATATPALATVYGAILRTSTDDASRTKARGILEKAVIGAPSLETTRAQLELARLYRDIGEPRLARKAYEEASRLPEARLESGLLLIEDGEPGDGRDTLDALIKEAGDRASANLLVEGARARMLNGDHAGATALFEQAEKAPGLVRWKLDRERGRLALRKADYAGAAQALARAIEECGDDAETFLLAADAASDGKQTKLLDRVKALAPKKLEGRPEELIVQGRLALAEGNYQDASKAYDAAVKALTAEKAWLRRMAQATFGRAVAAYFNQDDPTARNAFDFAIEQDPSIFAAYLYLGDMVKEDEPKRALELAQLAVKFNPDLIEGWVMLGTVASRLKLKKLRTEALTRVGELSPNSEALRMLQSLP